MSKEPIRYRAYCHQCDATTSFDDTIVRDEFVHFHTDMEGHEIHAISAIGRDPLIRLTI